MQVSEEGIPMKPLINYHHIKNYVEKEIQSQLNLTYNRPSLTNTYKGDHQFRLFYVLDKIDYVIDIEIDYEINHKGIMIFGPCDYGPNKLSRRHIRKSIKHIKRCINQQFQVEYYVNNERLGKLILSTNKDLSKNDPNRLFHKIFGHLSLSDLVNDKHPHGYTQIDKFVTTYTYKGKPKTFIKQNNQFIELKKDL